MSAPTASARRGYSSELREQQAAQTRERVIDAALARFSADGYEKTTIAGIAAEAKVSAETVRGLGSKAALIVAAADCISAAVGEGPLLETELGRRYLAIDGPEQFLDFTVQVSLDINRRSHGVYAAFAAAAAGDPELDAAWTARLAGARAELDELLGIWIDRGWARTDLPREELLANVWILTMPESYERLVVRAGFSEERYLSWLRRSLAEAVHPR
jgi:AcrR family transcriptional regulator